MSKIFFFLNYIYFHTFLQPISSVPQKLIRVPYSLSKIHTLSYFQFPNTIHEQIALSTTEKPRKPYGSGVSYAWTHVPYGTQYI